GIFAPGLSTPGGRKTTARPVGAGPNSVYSRHPMTLIAETAALAEFCSRQRLASFIAIDTEFMRDKTYWPQLCLRQIAAPQDPAAIDALAPGIDLSPLFELLADTNVTKVFHAARQDVEIFFHLTGKIPAPLVDTQVAAMVCG